MTQKSPLVWEESYFGDEKTRSMSVTFSSPVVLPNRWIDESKVAPDGSKIHVNGGPSKISFELGGRFNTLQFNLSDLDGSSSEIVFSLPVTIAHVGSLPATFGHSYSVKGNSLIHTFDSSVKGASEFIDDFDDENYLRVELSDSVGSSFQSFTLQPSTTKDFFGVGGAGSAAVPEPSSIALLGLGSLALVTRRKRKSGL